jgi:hypothetical protein
MTGKKIVMMKEKEKMKLSQNGQESDEEEIEARIYLNFPEQNKEIGKEDQEEKRRQAMRRLQGRPRRPRFRSLLLYPRQ